MTLDEAIKHCEEIAEQKKESIAEYEQNPIHYEKEIRYCKECASEHRQLAEWLRELKAYKDARVGCEYCKHKYREQHERPCSLCQRNFMDMFEREVNADEGVLEKINEKQDSLRATCKAWDEAISRDGYVD